MKTANPNPIKESHQPLYPRTPRPRHHPAKQANPKLSTRVTFVENPYPFEERHASLFEPLIQEIRQSLLREPQNEPTY